MLTSRQISVVVPVYNSAGTLEALTKRVDAALTALAADFELVLVNDGSRDESWQVIESLAQQHTFIHGINLMRNFGQHNALLAGVRAARFPIIVTIDDDLQHPPEEISVLLAQLERGYDVVYGTPVHLPHAPWRNVTSRLMKRFMAGVIGVKSARQISAFRAFRTDLRKAFETYQSPEVFLDVLLSWGTTRYSSVKVRHDPRAVGKSNYTFTKLVRQATMLLTGYSTKPLRLATFVGFGFTCFGIAVLFYVVARALLQGSIPGFPFLASIIALFSGAQLFALGIIGEYLAVTHNRLMERPIYVVRESVRAPSVPTELPEPVCRKSRSAPLTPEPMNIALSDLDEMRFGCRTAKEQAGCLLMDTLVYSARDLTKVPLPQDTGRVPIHLVASGEEGAVVAVAGEAFRGYAFSHYHADPRLGPADCDAVYASWARTLCLGRGNGSDVLVASANGAVLGFGAVRLNNPRDGDGVLYGVALAARQMGIYTSLVIHSLRWCYEKGAARMLMSTQINNTRVQRVCAGLGFVPDSAYYTFHKWFD